MYNLLVGMFKKDIFHSKRSKKARESCFFLCFSLVLFHTIFIGSVNLSAKDLTDKDTLTFSIKTEQRDTAWTYLRDKYGAKNFFLRKTDPALSTEFFSELRREAYFDTPDLALLRADHAVRYSIRAYNNDIRPGIKNEIVEILMSDIDGYGLDLARISNFGIILDDSIQFKVVHYNVTMSPDGKHRLLGIVKRAARPVFKDVLKKIGIENPFYLINVMNVGSRRAGFKIIHKDIPIGRIYLEEVAAEKFGIESLFCVLNFVPGAVLGSVLTSDEKDRIESAIADDLHKNLPAFHRAEKTGYQLVFNQLDNHFPFLKLLLRYPLLKKCGEVVLLSLSGLVVLVLFFYKRLFKVKKF